MAMSETCSVLVVEDETSVRTMLAEALSSEGFAVRAAADGRDALSVLERWRPDIILTDLNMPIMDGWAFRAELRRRPHLADIPVMVLSAASGSRLLHIDGLDAVAIMAKPCDLDALIDAIRRAAAPGRTEPLEPFPRLADREIATGDATKGQR
jgi:CheY-like chemotaxis protein